MQVLQRQVAGQRPPVFLVARSPVVADDVGNTSVVHALQHFHELIIGDAAEIPMIPSEGSALIGRVHVDDVVQGRLRHNRSEVQGRELGSRRQQRGNA